jgi:16S rRNA processing protein RimM
VGSVVKPHGLRGDLLVISHSDYARRFKPGQVLTTAEQVTLTVSSSTVTENGILVRFAEIMDRNAAESLGHVDLFIETRSRRPLGNDEYWPDELIGLEVRDFSGQTLGKVADIDDSTEQARLVVETHDGMRLVPFVTPLVPEVRLVEGFLVVSPVEGLFDA